LLLPLSFLSWLKFWSQILVRRKAAAKPAHMVPLPRALRVVIFVLLLAATSAVSTGARTDVGASAAVSHESPRRRLAITYSAEGGEGVAIFKLDTDGIACASPYVDIEEQVSVRSRVMSGIGLLSMLFSN
jgi:hypothetical protein